LEGSQDEPAAQERTFRGNSGSSAFGEQDSAGFALHGALDVFIAAEFDDYKIKVGKVKFKL
jgi:hypothetical protein